MNIEQAKTQVADEFPFPDYVSTVDDSHHNIASTVQKWLPAGARILDFASGPCDKTAIIQKLGYKCSAYDDLSDPWHNLPGNKEKIVKFAEDSGIELHVVKDRTFPFEPNSFDMVMAHAVLDHIHGSPRELLNQLVSFIKPNGFLFVTLPNAVNIRKRIAVLRGHTNMPPYDSYYWYPGSWRGHVREYVKDDLRRMSEYLQLDIVELRGCHHMVRRVNPLFRPIYLTLSALFTGWRDSWTLVARKPVNWETKNELEQHELDKIMTIPVFQ